MGLILSKTFFSPGKTATIVSKICKFCARYVFLNNFTTVSFGQSLGSYFFCLCAFCFALLFFALPCGKLRALFSCICSCLSYWISIMAFSSLKLTFLHNYLLELSSFKGDLRSYFTHYFCEASICFNVGLWAYPFLINYLAN